jgi:hypothetical protein
MTADLLDLSKYDVKPKIGGVVAWPVGNTVPDRRRDKRDIWFTVKAEVLKEAPADTKDASKEASKASATDSEKTEPAKVEAVSAEGASKSSSASSLSAATSSDEPAATSKDEL